MEVCYIFLESRSGYQFGKKIIYINIIVPSTTTGLFRIHWRKEWKRESQKFPITNLSLMETLIIVTDQLYVFSENVFRDQDLRIVFSNFHRTVLREK